MKRLALAFALLIAALAPRPAHAGGVLVLVDSLYVDNKNNYAPFFDLLSRSLKPGMKLTVTTMDSTVGSSGSYTLGDLRDSVSPTGTAPRFDYDLIIAMEFNDNDYAISGATQRRYPMQLSKAGNRPKVPVLYLAVGASLHNGSGDDSLGVNYHSDSATFQGASALYASPAGFAFPANIFGCKKRATGAGLYVTPVLTLACYSYTKADPDGVGGLFSNASCDTLGAWFYNPPIASTRVGLANAAGYGVMNWEPVAANAGGSNYPASNLAPIAVGMAAKLAPTIFAFPAQHVALDIDDGCKRFRASAQETYDKVADALAGIDSLGAWGIPFTYGIETDSMTVSENGTTRFATEWAAIRRYKLGRVTVHNHAGTSAGGFAADTSLATASGGVYTDIFGRDSNRYPFGSTTGTTRDQSVYALLSGATVKLIRAAGDPTLVSREVLPPGDDYSTKLLMVKGFGAISDSIAYAIALAGSSVGHGYRVVRTQYLADQYHLPFTGTGGFGRGFVYPLPDINTIGALLTPAVSVTYRSLLFAPSRYLWGTTTDTVSTQDYGVMRAALNNLIGTSLGYNRNIDVSTAQESGSSNLNAYKGVAKGVIWVTHIPNWRQADGTSVVYGGSRPAWEVTRQIHGVMEAARWCAMQANTSSTTYFRVGPMQWVYSDQITERDLR